MRAYLVPFDITKVPQDQVLAFLDTRSEFKNWFTPFLGTVLLVTESDMTSTEVTNLLRAQFPPAVFAVLPVSRGQANGWMPQVFWNLVNEPVSSGKWDKAKPDLMKLLGLSPPSAKEGNEALIKALGMTPDQRVEHKKLLKALGIDPDKPMTLGELMKSKKDP